MIKKDTQVRCNIHEDERVEQVVRTVFQEEPGHELPRDGDLARRDALVQSECWRRRVRQQGFVERWHWAVRKEIIYNCYLANT